MFEHLYKRHKLMEADGIFAKYGLTTDDMNFVTELMAGPSNRGNAVSGFFVSFSVFT